ncbi:MAG: hypothetical protein C7B46_04880 [Sulfobacillus benefaciens]|uniref:NADPH-dependent FMN reductase-like domain-containing protein n=1 Tax=Sulfobacillus benefaciens TaxID=453960 RepID=A0A2T2XIZ4_9FIRM|nr:MAG: hypothetical protein C7B46_04880 [Sulfobacillus benefaciens]
MSANRDNPKTQVARIAIIVGNPKPMSRTRDVAEAIAHTITQMFHAENVICETRLYDLATMAPYMFDAKSDVVASAVRDVCSASLLVVASPTYKGTYTGLLKAFLDWFRQGSLQKIVTIPVMLGSSPRHAMAVELYLRSLLVELGGVVPTHGLYILEDQLENLPSVIDPWAHVAKPSLLSTLARLHEPTGAEKNL